MYIVYYFMANTKEIFDFLEVKFIIICMVRSQTSLNKEFTSKNFYVLYNLQIFMCLSSIPKVVSRFPPWSGMFFSLPGVEINSE